MEVESVLVDCSPGGPHEQYFDQFAGIIANADGSVILSDLGEKRVFIVASDGSVSMLAGSGSSGWLDGRAYEAQFDSPQGLLKDSHGNLILVDAGNHSIRKISTRGFVTTVAGWSGTEGFYDGSGVIARFCFPISVAESLDGSIFVADSGNNCIRKISHAGDVTTFAGCGDEGHLDGPGETATFSGPMGLAVSPEGCIFVADHGNNAIRKISPDCVVSTLGNSSGSDVIQPSAVQIDSDGHVLVVDMHGVHRITLEGVATKLLGGIEACHDIALRRDGKLLLLADERVYLLCETSAPPRKVRRLSSDIGSLLDDANDADVEFVVQGERIKAHRLILSARSTYFHKMLKSNFREGKPGMEIVLKDMTPAVFRVLMRFIYAEEVNLTDTTAVQVMQLAHMYDLKDLYERCMMYCRQNLQVSNCITWLLQANSCGLVDFRAVALAYVAPRLRSGEIQKHAPDSISDLTANRALMEEVLLNFQTP